MREEFLCKRKRLVGKFCHFYHAAPDCLDFPFELPLVYCLPCIAERSHDTCGWYLVRTELGLQGLWLHDRDERHVNCQAVDAGKSPLPPWQTRSAIGVLSVFQKERAALSCKTSPVACKARVRQVKHVFFPRVRTPCGHGAQVIVEGREEQSDGGEKNKETQHHPKQTNTTTKGPQAVSPPSCSLSSVQGETCETKTSI